MLMIPSYLAETAPQELRGLIGGQIQIQIMFSQVIANLINYGTKQLETDACWMIPLGKPNPYSPEALSNQRRHSICHACHPYCSLPLFGRVTKMVSTIQTMNYI